MKNFLIPTRWKVIALVAFTVLIIFSSLYGNISEEFLELPYEFTGLNNMPDAIYGCVFAGQGIFENRTWDSECNLYFSVLLLMNYLYVCIAFVIGNSVYNGSKPLNKLELSEEHLNILKVKYNKKIKYLTVINTLISTLFALFLNYYDPFTIWIMGGLILLIPLLILVLFLSQLVFILKYKPFESNLRYFLYATLFSANIFPIYILPHLLNVANLL